MYFKIPYDFMILRSVFTIRVCFAFSVPCYNHDFNNLVAKSLSSLSLGPERKVDEDDDIHIEDCDEGDDYLIDDEEEENSD
jgi:hypothetical protein